MYEMKESGIEWIGQIPKHWEVRKVKYIVHFINGYAFNSALYDDRGNCNIVRIGDINNGTIIYDDIIKVNANEYYLKKFRIKKHDILLAMSGATVGKIAYIKNDLHNFFVNQRVGIIRCPYNKFFYFFLSTNYFNEYIKLFSTGSAQPNISLEYFNYFYTTFPPLEEQKKIADFLDKKVSEIENLIDDTKKLIEKYREYKQSIITETVTKGLNNNVEMKESGIEWIGQIPKHWKIKLVKELFYNVNNKNIGVKEKNLLSLSYGKIIQKDIYKNDGLVPANFNNYNIIKYDDIVLRLTDLQNDKKSLRVGHVREKGIITSAYITLRPISNYSTRYYYFLLHFYDICKYFYGLGSGVRQSLSFEEVKKILVLFPPLNEQEEIVKYLDYKCSQIDNIIEEKQSLLEKLEEYKKSLIYEYVTGKKQVENE